MKVGLDIGSTTIKCVVIENDQIIYKNYQRHFSHIKESIISVLNSIKPVIGDNNFYFAMSGSAGMGLANSANIPFIQEVYATRVAANKYIPNADCIIELGGEDAKILFLSNGLEVRMNGTCAGGTGAFIDQMSTLLNVPIEEMNELAKKSEKLYTIASRCGVFAKTDIQPLLNQGAKKSDISASIFKSVVNQTIGGLAQGREIKGNIIYLGGPLTFLSELRNSFDESLNLKGLCPENSLYYVSLGAALSSDKLFTFDEIINSLEKSANIKSFSYIDPLFKDENELISFRKRHEKAFVPTLPLKDYEGNLYLGIDSGSTTLKLVLIDEDLNIRYSYYTPNKGNPVSLLKNLLINLYTDYPNIKICGSASTGYGEDLIKNAFNLDGGLVETIAHFTAAKHFKKDVDFIIDIGGQDIKCFKIENGVISNIFLNEACSSGCGSFLQTFANALGYDIKDFAKIGLLAKKPVDLGSRCTVFMNSSVKQAQKDGATIDNISAGLSISVVKNALYKVIRISSAKDLGKNIVVQGGTFHNEAVLRAFEKEIGVNVIRPNISGVMGAYGAAIYAKKLKLQKSNILNLNDLQNFEHKVSNVNCGLCNNHCNLTINVFKNGKRMISGNKCEKPVTKKTNNLELNLYSYIQNKLDKYHFVNGNRGVIAIPLVLNNYELLPFWSTFFSSLGYEVHTSGFSNGKLFNKGQHTIPSDTICYPAKLVHGHMEELIDQGYKNIFYPCMTYNIDEKKGDNHFNCPVVAYYPENVKNNIEKLKSVNFISGYLNLANDKIFEKKIYSLLNEKLGSFTKKEIHNACVKAYEEYKNYLQELRDYADKIISKARKENRQIIVLAGRPYHVDPEINHGIDKLITSFGACVITEESISHLTEKFTTNITNQWTYHARLYSAAKYVTTQKDMNLIQLVSFGCGLDAITTDETKLILEEKNKIYTQIKIDEITNLGAVKIRLRSLFAALEQKENEDE